MGREWWGWGPREPKLHSCSLRHDVEKASQGPRPLPWGQMSFPHPACPRGNYLLMRDQLTPGNGADAGSQFPESPVQRYQGVKWGGFGVWCRDDLVKL